jgi:FkbM family methyltransferase
LWKGLVKGQLRKKGYGHIESRPREVVAAIRLVEPHMDRFQALYERLDDDLSRDLLVKLLAFRCLGYTKVKLPTNTPSYWEGLEKVEKLADKSDFIQLDFKGWKLFKMGLLPLGYPIDLYAMVSGAHVQFALQQYRGISESSVVQVEPADCVIDAGACWGDSALYCAYRTGSAGRVFSFEFVPGNLEILKRNLSLNSELSGRVRIVERAVWSESNLPVFFEDNGPGSVASFEKTARAGGTVLTLSIDDFVAQERLPRVDFIKMDIEGAELPALKGAVRTLQHFRPRLAICVYHNLTDLLEIPEFILSLGLDYRLFLRHFTIHAEETVLFAWAVTA